ncbi:MAG: glycosyltransferase [Candidatus Colwellbacteria bacterium]|nr:glycosyltransferase [Candidatus Colwellbacteria bacterium]
MKIGIFTNNFTPLVNGVVVSISTFRKGLEKLGHEVFVFAPRFKGYDDQDSRIFRFPSVSTSYKAKYPVPLPTIRSAERFIKKNGLDLIHAQHPWGVASSALKLARKLSLPIVFTNHTRYEFYIDYVPPLLPKHLAIKLIERMAARYANKTDVVIAPTPGIKDYLIKNGVRESLIRILPSGIDFSILESAPDAKLRERFNIPQDHKIILYFGRVGPEKNLITILEAYKHILKEEKKTALIVAGGTKGAESYLEFLKQSAVKLDIAHKTHFTGIVEPEERGGYFREGDVFIHSSLSETQGLIITDSMAFGVPVVAIRASGVVDIVVDGENGLIMDNSAKALASGVLRVLRDNELRDKLSRGAKKSAQEYTVEAVTSRLEKVYQEVLIRKRV